MVALSTGSSFVSHAPAEGMFADDMLPRKIQIASSLDGLRVDDRGADSCRASGLRIAPPRSGHVDADVRLSVIIHRRLSGRSWARESG